MWSFLCGLACIQQGISAPNGLMRRSLSELSREAILNLPVSHAAHPNHVTDIPERFGNAQELREFLLSSADGRVPIVLHPENNKWSDDKLNALLQELDSGESKLELFSQGDSKILVRVISVANIRVFNAEVGDGYYLVDVRSQLPPNPEGAHSEKGAFPKVGWKLVAGPMLVAEDPLASAQRALETCGIDGGAAGSLSFLKIVTTNPALQAPFGLVPEESVELSGGIPACPSMFPGLGCLMQVYVFEARAAGLAPPPDFLKTTKTDGSGMFWAWEQLRTPPPQCGRRQLAEVATSEQAWYREWIRRFECYWLALPNPTQMRLGSCLGALGLHLGSRLDGVLGRPVTLTGHSEQGCEWIKDSAPQLQLPAFPELGSFEFTLPPIPRLLPSWQRLQSLANSRVSVATQPLSWRPTVVFGVGAGVVILLLAFVAVLLRRAGSGSSRRLDLGQQRDSERHSGQMSL